MNTSSSILAHLEVLPMNNDAGKMGLRSLAATKGIKSKGVGKVELIRAVHAKLVAELPAPAPEVTPAPTVEKATRSTKKAAKATVETVDAVDAAAVASAEKLHTVRNANSTIRPVDTAIVDVVWNLFTRGTTNGGVGATTSEIIAAVMSATPCKAGAVVSRLATQRNNGNLTTITEKDAKNRDIALWFAAPSWTKEEMARSFLKIKA